MPKAFDLVHLGGGEITKQNTFTFYLVFSYDLEAKMPLDSGMKTWKGLLT